MIKIKSPEYSLAVQELKRGLVGKRKQYHLTISEERQISEIYQRYEHRKGYTEEFLKGAHLDVAFKQAIQNTYRQVGEGMRLEDLRARILLDTQICPCCGLVNSDTIDHYLPQENYPALAIYPSNLIPYCQKCNNLKRSIDGSIKGERFVHVYYDQIPADIQFLYANVSMAQGALAIDFELREVSGMDSSLFSDLSFQLNRVDFYRRAKRESNNFLGGLATYIESDYQSAKAQGVKLGLNKNHKRNFDLFGINNWRTTLLESLSECHEFCNGGFYTALGIQK